MGNQSSTHSADQPLGGCRHLETRNRLFESVTYVTYDDLRIHRRVHSSKQHNRPFVVSMRSRLKTRDFSTDYCILSSLGCRQNEERLWVSAPRRRRDSSEDRRN